MREINEVEEELRTLLKMRDMIADSVISLTFDQRLLLNTRIETLQWVLED